MAQRLTPTVKCEVCYERYKSLAGHLKKHGHNVKTYKEQFNGAPVVSPMTLRKMQLARLKFILKKRGKLINAPKNLAKSLAQMGKVHSPETREKIRQARLGKKLTDAHRMAISASLMGHEVSAETRLKLSQVEFTPEHRRKLSMSQSAEKGNAWKGGRSRFLYMGKGKYRLKRIFGAPLRCFYPGCDQVEGLNVRSVDCHHIDGDHENNPLDGMNWLPLCRRHHMMADGRLSGLDPAEAEKARKLAARAHSDFMKENYIGEIKTYHD
jgi:hypothetical protein